MRRRQLTLRRATVATVPRTQPDQLPGLTLWLSAEFGASTDGSASFAAASSQRLESEAAPLAVGDFEFTWAGWVLSSQASNARCFGARDPGGAGGWEVGFDGNWYATAYGPSGSGLVYTSAAPSPVNAWRYVCAWRTISPNAISLQIDNGAVLTASLPGPVAAGSSPLHVGNVGSWGSRYWDGRVDSLGRWDRVLGAAERAWLFNSGAGRVYGDLAAGNPGLLAGLVSWWDLDEASGPRLDRHGSNHLTPVNGPTLAAGLATGSATTGSTIARWPDRSGNARHATQTTPERRPTYQGVSIAGRPALAADGVDDELLLPTAILPATGDFTAVAVFRTASLTEQPILSNNAGQAGRFDFKASSLVGGTGRLMFFVGGSPNFVLTGATTTHDGATHVGVVRRSGGTFQLFLDGKLDGQASGSPAIDQATPASAFGKLQRFNGTCAEIVVYDRALSDPELNGLVGHLGGRYGVPVGVV